MTRFKDFNMVEENDPRVSRPEQLLCLYLQEKFRGRAKITVVNLTWGKPRGTKTDTSTPDTYWCMFGHCVPVELKSKGGRLDHGQKEFIADAKRYGVTVWVIDSLAKAEDMYDFYKRTRLDLEA